MMTSSGLDAQAPVSEALRREIEAFLYYEARLLDKEDYERWLAMLTADIKYVVPTAPSLYRRESRATHQKDIAHIEDGFADLERRVKRFQDPAAWAEDPPTRHCHVVTNIEIEITAKPDEYRVYSAFVNSRGRFEMEDVIMMGRREDILRREARALRLAERRVFLTQNVLLSRNINTFL